MNFMLGLLIGALLIFGAFLFGAERKQEEEAPTIYLLNSISQKLNNIEEQQKRC